MIRDDAGGFHARSGPVGAGAPLPGQDQVTRAPVLPGGLVALDNLYGGGQLVTRRQIAAAVRLGT